MADGRRVVSDGAARPAKLATRIYHITHTENLLSMIEQQGIWCDKERTNRGLAVKGIAHENLKTRRARKRVPNGNGGTLADYVPFYFAPRSPMLYAINQGVVAGYAGTQRDIVHLVSTVEAVVHRELPFVYTDGHAYMGYTLFYDDAADLRTHIDWPLMKDKYWGDTEDDSDRTRRRQAEFLVYRHFPWEAILGIGTYNVSVAALVKSRLDSASFCPEIRVERTWYY